MKKIIKIVPFGSEDLRFYTLFVCDPEEFEVFKKMDYYSETFIVHDLRGCKVGDLVKVKKYYNLSDFLDVYYEIYKGV